MALEFTGLKKATDQMEGIRLRVRDAGRRKALRNAGNIIRDAMIERTPVQAFKNLGSDSLDPGEVKASIRVRLGMENDEPIALIGPRASDYRVGRAAGLVEYGHRMVTGGTSKLDAAGILQGGGKVHAEDVPAYPFLRPAFDSSEQAAKEELVATLAREISDEVT